ncbi:MAG: hypothetical protein IJB91_03090 [Oscillospiraceae bacterium]|nr:hypothetical protein [Oscillospiraceae bacterium]
MKRTLVILLLLSLILTGCSNAADANLHTKEASQMNPFPSTSTVATEPTNTTETIQTTLPTEELLVPAEKNDKTTEEVPQKNEEAATEPTVPSATGPVPTEPTPTEKPQPTEPPKETQPAPTEPAPSEPESVPTEPAPTQPETPPSRPETTPTEPIPTEPAGCAHEWSCIHHKEEGHWRAGVVCDCGWTAYGNADTLVSLWNAHSASYPAAESLFDHGGFGCIDEWIVDKPAYDEWVCRHCGESKS